MSDATIDRDPIEVVADSFLARFRAGERPSIEEYAARHPELAERDPRAAAGPGDARAGPVDRRRRPARARVGPPARSRRRPAAARRLPDPPRDRPGRHGRRLRGRAGQSLGRHVALKVLPGQRRAATARALERFRREARAAARLHHTNIVPVFDVGRGRRRRLLRHAVHPGPGPGRGHRRAAAAPRPRARTPGGAEDPGPSTAARERPRRAAVPLLTGRLATLAGRAVRERTALAATGDRPGRAGRRPATRRTARIAGLGPGLARPTSSAATARRRPVSTSDRLGPPAPFFRSVAQIGRQVGRGAGLRPRQRHRPPRHQAVEPAAGHRGGRLDHRLRPGQGGTTTG